MAQKRQVWSKNLGIQLANGIQRRAIRKSKAKYLQRVFQVQESQLNVSEQDSFGKKDYTLQVIRYPGDRNHCSYSSSKQ